MPNDFPTRFTDRLANLKPYERALDCGSGGRERPHPQCVMLDMVDHPNVDIIANALSMPFSTGEFSLILSQAVIEHVTDPQRYVDECHRVLRHGGIMYTEIAFMQPVHQAPHHYFNVTPFGLRHLYRDWEIIEDGTLGSFAGTIEWISHEAGVKVHPPRREPTSARMPNVASGVYAICRRVR